MGNRRRTAHQGLVTTFLRTRRAAIESRVGGQAGCSSNARLKLVHIVAAWEQRPPPEQLAEDAPRRPHIDSWTVRPAAKQELRSAIPARHHISGGCRQATDMDGSPIDLARTLKHKAMTHSVRCCAWPPGPPDSPMPRARPKSQTARSQFELTRTAGQRRASEMKSWRGSAGSWRSHDSMVSGRDAKPMPSGCT